MKHLLDCSADICAEDKFKNTALNDALRHRLKLALHKKLNAIIRNERERDFLELYSSTN